MIPSIVSLRACFLTCYHRLINYIDTKAKCCHLKNWPVKGLCGGVGGLQIQPVMLVISAQLCECYPSNLLSGSTLPPLSPSLPCVKYSIQFVAGRGWGMLKTIFCRSLILCIWPDSEPTKLLDHHKQNPSWGGGLRQINTCRKVPLRANCFRWRRFAFVST